MSETMMGLQKEIVGVIKGFVSEAPENRFATIDGSPIFAEPLIGFADGDDTLFGVYKRVIGEFYLTPREAMRMHFGDTSGEQLQIPNLTVISWVLPVADETRLSNARMDHGPSARWNQTRWHGEDFITCLKKHLVGFLGERGCRAVAPSITPFFQVFNLSNGQASNWSERHTAYAAGLGTFGLNDALITARGVAHRVGSVVVDVALPPTPRPYEDHNAYCPFFQDGSCGACIDRCPAGAVTTDGHNKVLCQEYYNVELKSWIEERRSEGYVGPYSGCGLCMTAVPCEAGIPPLVGRAS